MTVVIYTVPATSLGQITRYDTNLPFSLASSYTVYDTTAIDIRCGYFYSAIYGGKYIFLFNISSVLHIVYY